MTVVDKNKKTAKMNKNWDTAKADAIKSMEQMMKDIKVTPPPKGNKNGLMEWDYSQEKPSFNLNSKQVDNMPDAKPGDTIKIMMECTVKRCEINEDQSTDFRLEVEKLAIV